MQTLMDDSQVSTLEQVREFLEGTGRVGISIPSKADGYAWVWRTLIRLGKVRHDQVVELVQTRYGKACYAAAYTIPGALRPGNFDAGPTFNKVTSDAGLLRGRLPTR